MADLRNGVPDYRLQLTTGAVTLDHVMHSVCRGVVLFDVVVVDW